jgi:hypothetical protein
MWRRRGLAGCSGTAAAGEELVDDGRPGHPNEELMIARRTVAAPARRAQRVRF